jgi:hypothetical protein
MHQRLVPGSRAQIIVAAAMPMPLTAHTASRKSLHPAEEAAQKAPKTAISIKDAATTKRLPMSLCRSRRMAPTMKRTE